MTACCDMGNDFAQADRSKRHPRVCFVAPNAYGMLSGRADLNHIGGAETQLSLVARGLVERGYPVSFVVWDHGQPDGETRNGVQVFKACPRDAGMRVVRFVHPRATSLWAALRRANADMYVRRTADSDIAVVAAWCRRHGRKFVYSAASDTDCLRDLPRLSTRHERVLYRYGLRRADRIIAQTFRQQQLLADQFGLASDRIGSCAPEPPIGELPEGNADERPRVLWVGRFAPVKRFELCLDLAERLPDCAFDVVGEPERKTAYTEGLVGRARRLSNVTMHDRVPYAQMGGYYRRARLLICTSQWEGLPNTFLEAWSRGVPTVSTFDLDGAIASESMGRTAQDVDGLVSAVSALVADGALWQTCSQRARAYFLRHCSVATVTDAYEALIVDVLAGRPSATAGMQVAR